MTIHWIALTRCSQLNCKPDFTSFYLKIFTNKNFIYLTLHILNFSKRTHFVFVFTPTWHRTNQFMFVYIYARFYMSKINLHNYAFDKFYKWKPSAAQCVLCTPQVSSAQPGKIYCNTHNVPDRFSTVCDSDSIRRSHVATHWDMLPSYTYIYTFLS